MTSYFSYRRVAQWLRLPLSLVLLLALVGTAVAADPSDTPRQNLWTTDGFVNTVVLKGNTLYIGGAFFNVGPVTGSGVPLNATTGAVLPTFPSVEGRVEVAVRDGSGGWYIGGSFTQVGSTARNNLAHILANYSVDPAWNPDADNTVYTLAVSGTTVYVGGDFTQIGTITRNHIAALATST